VRENALVSLVILCSHHSRLLGDALQNVIDALATVVREDRNVFAVGLAMDALNRLLAAPAGVALGIDRLRAEADALFATTPILCLESLHRGGQGWTPGTASNAAYAHFG
jgi:hypothetical protein